MARREIIECDWCGDEIEGEDEVIKLDDKDMCSWRCVKAVAEHEIERTERAVSRFVERDARLKRTMDEVVRSLFGV